MEQTTPHCRGIKNPILTFPIEMQPHRSPAVFQVVSADQVGIVIAAHSDTQGAEGSLALRIEMRAPASAAANHGMGDHGTCLAADRRCDGFQVVIGGLH